MTLKLECTFMADAFPAKEMWQILCSSRRDVLKPDLICDLYGNPVKVGDVAALIEKKRKLHFTVECESGRYHYSPLGGFDQCLLQISGSVESAEGAEKWMVALLSSPTFIQARLYDEDYESWQNSKDPLQYEVCNQSFVHLPMKSNGLPPPLEQMEIDVSNNPGRRIIHEGFIEAVGSLMWISPEFMNRVGLTTVKLLSEPWLNVQEFTGGVLLIKTQEDVFTMSYGEEGRKQHALRNLLFHSFIT